MTASTCTALVLSGGGSNGAWEAGVFWGLTHYGNPENFKYDVLSGVSAGSINTGFIVGTAIGTEVQASEYLSDLWANMKNEYIYKKWDTGGPLRWLTEYPSIFDNSPSVEFANTMISYFPNGIQRMFNMGSVNVETGEFHNFTEKNTSLEQLPDAVIASSSVPGAFPPHYYQGNYYMDGMTAWNTNMSSAITRCLEIVDDES
jgi:predicted acylesterase/phospholipase RssA